jgi:hypothetical protein
LSLGGTFLAPGICTYNNFIGKDQIVA